MKIFLGIVDTAFRSNVLGGVAPASVASIQSVVTPEAVAVAILSGVENRRQTVYVPEIGRLFRLVGVVAHA